MCLLIPIFFAGTPATVIPLGISFVTTAPAPIQTFEPILTCSTIYTPGPTYTLFPIIAAFPSLLPMVEYCDRLTLFPIMAVGLKL